MPKKKTTGKGKKQLKGASLEAAHDLLRNNPSGGQRSMGDLIKQAEEKANDVKRPGAPVQLKREATGMGTPTTEQVETIADPRLQDFLDGDVSVEFSNDSGTFTVKAVNVKIDQYSIFIFFNPNTVQFVPKVGASFVLGIGGYEGAYTTYYPGTTTSIPELDLTVIAMIREDSTQD